MCAIIGIKCEDVELSQFVMSELLIQSQIRGKHATGISYVDSGKIKTITKPISSKQFVKQGFVPEASLMIGHCRYSTSDIQYNQPISNAGMSIVHNGVITQESFESWQKHFGYNEDDFKTRNDTELLLKCYQAGHNPFHEFPNASIAAGILQADKIICLRNNTRPLWLMISEYFIGFASTENIIERTSKSLGIEIEAMQVPPYAQFEIGKDVFCSNIWVDDENTYTKPTLFKTDQQIHTESENKYLKNLD